jgi:hypothetical protein
MRAVLLVAFLATSAHADVIGPAQAACGGKSVGDACDGGACANTKCTRYALQPDGNRVPSDYDCVTCVAGAPVTGDAGGAGGGTSPRIAIGAGLAVVLIAGGILLAYRRAKRVGDVSKPVK